MLIPADLLPLVLGQFGALVLALVMAGVFFRLYREERARNSVLVDKFAEATGSGNAAIRDLTDAVVDVVELAQGEQPASRLRRRARDA